MKCALCAHLEQPYSLSLSGRIYRHYAVVMYEVKGIFTAILTAEPGR